MTREEAKRFWLIRYENAKDFSDLHWEAQERREHREYVEALRMAIEALQTEAVQGEWIDTGNWMGIECSRCKCHSRYVTPFCPQCGAKMKGGENK